jgi:tetrapyrrole methylase family protein / MazG family protein
MTAFERLVSIVKELRGPNGCPWDKAQTFESLTPYAIEEAYELEQAILNKDYDNVVEELGDLLFQSVLHSEIADQEGRFNMDDVIEHLSDKMVRRHPHVFAQTSVSSADEVVQNWEHIKSSEKSQPLKPDIPLNFPALLRAQKIGKFSKKVGFDWETPQQVMLKIREELEELQQALDRGDQAHSQEELGDLLFSCAQLARHLDFDAEKSLRLANDKFLRRWDQMIQTQPNFMQLNREQKEELWQKTKKSSGE